MNRMQGKLGGGTHDDSALNPEVCLLIQPDLYLLSTLQETEYQVLQAATHRWISARKAERCHIAHLMHVTKHVQWAGS